MFLHLGRVCASVCVCVCVSVLFVMEKPLKHLTPKWKRHKWPGVVLSVRRSKVENSAVIDM